MAAVLKVTFRAEVRRCLLDKQDLCYEGLTRRVDELYPELPQYTAKYMDEEGDVCTLCEASFADFLEVSSQAKSATANNLGSDTKVILKLELEVPGVSKVSSKPPTAVPPAVPEEPDLEIISGPAPMTVQEVNVPITPAPTASVFVDKAPESPRPAAAPASDVPADEDFLVKRAAAAT
ncbi:unnamed protein product [Symbiodinium pilosum]|uniref:PB1 domain-containing protein n=1 Tax=Symbiodinium pilosum TaxID=2952 RepID=A0A812LIC0_SYMPI|nr:unnamed protein product [Symbiodinium pilosum]